MAAVTISHLFIHRVEQFRLDASNPIPDGKGGFGENMASQGILKCRIWPANWADLQLAGQKQAQVSHAIVFPPGTVVKVDDELLWEGKTLLVRVANIRPSGDLTDPDPIYEKVLAEEVVRG